MHISFRKLGHQFDYAPIVLVLGAVILLPNIFFGGPTWWLSALKLLLFVAYCCWFLRCWWRGGHISRWRLHSTLLLFVLPVLFGLFQLLPLQVLSPALHQARAAVSDILQCRMETRALSFAPDLTRVRIELLLLCLGVFLLICARMNHRTLIRILFLGISFAALGNVIYAFGNVFLNRNHGNFKEMVFHGMFLNRNHFGFLIVMGIFSVLGLLFSLRRHHHYKDRGEEYQPLYMRIKWSFLLMLELLVLLSGLFLSLSRGAILGLSIGLVIFGYFALPHAIRAHVIHRRTAVLLVLFVAVMVFALPYSLEKVASRFAKMEEIEGLDSRVQVWKQLLPAIRDHAWTGAGSGAFSTVCQKYFDDHASYLEYAHNDYLEFLVEQGVLPSILMFTVMVLLWRGLFRRLKHQHEPVRRWCGLAGMSALTGCAVHEFLDYGLQAWANSLVFTAMLAGIVLCTRTPTPPPQESRREIQEGRFGWRLLYLCLFAACALLFVCGLRDLRSEIAFTRLQADLAEAVPFWQLSLNDDLQRVRWANVALSHTLREREALVARAKSKFNAAERDMGRREQWKEEAYLDMARALEIAPRDPGVANDCAFWLGASGLLTPEQSLRLCEWAVECQPAIAVTSSMAAKASVFYYMQAVRENAPYAAEYRRRMFRNMRVALANSPEDKELYGMLTRTDATREELLDVAPPSFKIHKLLVECLLGRRDLEGCLLMCGRMRTDAEQAEDENEKRQWHLEAIATEMSVRRQMEGEEERLAVLWTELEEALMEVSRGRLEKPLRMRQKGYLRAAAEEIYAATRMRPVAASVLLQSAQILSENGEWGRIPFVLEGLLTAPGAVRPMEELREGLRLLEHADDLLPSARIRREFLLSALRIQMAEAGDAGVSPEDCARKLEQLYRARGQGEKGAWLQEHLLPLYAARGWLLAGNTVNAVSDLRLCLDVCPDNGYAIQLLGKISLDYLTNRERHLHDWMKEGAAAPVAETSVGLRWIGVHHRPLTLRPGELVRTTDFLFLVEQEVDQELTAQLSFHNDAGQKLFTAQKPRVMRKSSSLTWRIGELIEFTSDERFVKGPGQLYPPGRLFLQFRLVDFKKRPAQMWPEGLLPAGCMEAQAEPEKEK